jgi:hypothetical protein
MVQMDEQPDKSRTIHESDGTTVVIVRASTILAGVAVVLAVLAIFTSVGLGKSDLGEVWERTFWSGAVVSALIAFYLERCRRR